MSPEYRVILADPAWQFGWDHGNGAAAHHYPTMPTPDICALPVSALATPDALLFLWACWPLLPDALEVMRAWGFTYRTLAWVWIKKYAGTSAPYMGNGQYTRQVSEPCYIAVRGAGHQLIRDHSVRALLEEESMEALTDPIYAVRRAHSRKPDEQYPRLDQLIGPVPRVELFARRRWTSWASWGHGVTGTQSLAAWIADGPAYTGPAYPTPRPHVQRLLFTEATA